MLPLRLALIAAFLAVGGHACWPGSSSTMYNGWCMWYVDYGWTGTLDNYNKSAASCDAFGGGLAHLPIIRSQSDNDQFVLKLKQKNNYTAFLGIVCDDAHNFIWADGTKLNYTNFANGTATRCDETTRFSLSPLTSKWEPIDSHKYTNTYCQQVELQKASTPCDDFLPLSNNNRNTTCYQWVPWTNKWDQANTDCKLQSANIMSIHSKQDNDFTRRTAISGGFTNGVLIGMRQTAAGSNNWTWVDGTPVDYTNWAKGFPAAILGDCVVLSTWTTTGEWKNEDCNNAINYFCSRPGNVGPALSPPTCPDSIIFKEGDHIYSPGYPYSYPGDLECDYYLVVANGNRVEMEIVYIETNWDDQLLLYDGTAGDKFIAGVSGSNQSGKKWHTVYTNAMRVSWRPKSGVNVIGWHIIFRTY